MLVYGDHHESAGTWEFVGELNCDLLEIRCLAPGLERHARLVSLLIEAGRLLQGLADAAVARDRRDRQTPATEEVTAFLSQVARAVCRSWESGFQELEELQPLQLPGDFPSVIELKLPEGFAFYAVYPEAYLEAARRLELTAPPRVIGIRSIGTSLAAIVAAVLNADPPVTVRPFGDPFAREIALSPELERTLLDGEAHYVVVDEGPGLSGSSFAAVADWLTYHGVAADRIVLMPSHAGAPGSAAPADRQRWWRETRREVGHFEGCWPDLITQWCSSAFGWDVSSIDDVSGGAWRRLHYEQEDDWPPVLPPWERRKFFVEAGGERFLLKFAGLGRIGQTKLSLARTLYAQGFTPEPIGLVHGFLAGRWCEGSRPLGVDERPVHDVAHYIGARARLDARHAAGASICRLFEMARRNVSVEFGEDFSRDLLSGLQSKAPALESRVRRIRTDNKLDRWEWLRTSTGTVIKTDALDHHQAHDLIGCQDMAWDAAGAIVEFDLDHGQRRTLLVELAAAAGRTVDDDLLGFCLVAYPAFRLGQARLGAAACGDAVEKDRVVKVANRYANVLKNSSKPA